MGIIVAPCFAVMEVLIHRWSRVFHATHRALHRSRAINKEFAEWRILNDEILATARRLNEEIIKHNLSMYPSGESLSS